MLVSIIVILWLVVFVVFGRDYLNSKKRGDSCYHKKFCTSYDCFKCDSYKKRID